ncbi:hypothetical protein V1478_000464 [Vespula squamosa]|uniref:Uncharacterized protein n=1 Tax=Vespula squamosa TaxID=30214 RepID=A0ABD2C5J4_VESSQ
MFRNFNVSAQNSNVNVYLMEDSFSDENCSDFVIRKFKKSFEEKYNANCVDFNIKLQQRTTQIQRKNKEIYATGTGCAKDVETT